ncbi:hypothetical protein Thal_0124 [Thermocrinis albus DSM 14484]|uniref:DUF4382 domain-containing protein n=1 Tax=Thermocrinis albus (strain DSM 14484 / JCM 11386 / HI 11/12) TaxID=638303 RepID=D3SNM4_THEAH|nr:DUF4382 domain-containing protein [Thermocrinis albus]ADC88761.1 hypothetical protein Thal_0124 [Thermocrinis albus DSM 14484]
MKKKLALLLTVFAAGCGGGGGGSSSGSVPLYFTDDASIYPSVTVKVYQVNLCSDNNCNTKVNLYDNQNGLAVDLAKLNGVLQYINTANVPQGTYNRLEIILDKNLTITDPDGINHDAVFVDFSGNPNKPNVVHCDNNTQKCYIRFNGTIQPLSMGKLVVDFQLKEFKVDTSGQPWRVTEVKVSPITPSGINKMKLYLSVQAVSSDTITGTMGGKTYTVKVTPNTRCEIGGENFVGSDCVSQVQPNMCLEVKTTSDPAVTTNITALELEQENPEKCSMTGSLNYTIRKFKGQVFVFDPAQRILTISTPTQLLISFGVNDKTYCEYNDNYYNGTDCFSYLTPGKMVEVKADPYRVALKIEIED